VSDHFCRKFVLKSEENLLSLLVAMKLTKLIKLEKTQEMNETKYLLDNICGSAKQKLGKIFGSIEVGMNLFWGLEESVPVPERSDMCKDNIDMNDG